MLNLLKMTMIWGMVIYSVWNEIDKTSPILITGLIGIAGIVFFESLRDGGWQTIKDIYGWLIRLLARPVVNRYETREKNYKDVIKKMDSQLFAYKDVEQRNPSRHRVMGIMEEPGVINLYCETVNYSGSLYYKDKEL